MLYLDYEMDYRIQSEASDIVVYNDNDVSERN